MLLKKMRKLDNKISYLKNLRKLKQLHAMRIKIYKTTLVVRTEIKANAKIAFKALQTVFPKKILKHENSSQLVVMRSK